MKKNLDIETLRAFAILAVLFNHSFPFATTDGSTYLWFQKFINGWGGVDLFFVVSGFVISLTLIESINEAKRCKEPLKLRSTIKAFWIKRFFRLFPTAFFWEIVVILGAIFFNVSGSFGGVKEDLFDLATFITFTRNITLAVGWDIQQPIGSYWSLSLEDQFYILLPLFLVFVATTRGRVWCLAMVVLAQLFISRPVWHGIWFLRTDALAMGVLLFLFSRGKEIYAKIEPTFLKNKAFAIIFFSLLFYALLRVPRALEGRFYTTGLVGVLSLGLVWVASYGKDYTFPFARRFFHYLGARSYALYVIHGPVFYFSKECIYRLAMWQGRPFDARYGYPLLGLSYGLLILFSEINFRCLEMPIRTYGARMAERVLIGQN